jgi:hypothetical protein
VAAATAREGDPDVYCIVLDGYARADMLAAHYGFDNSGFIQALERRGFQVAAASEANYSWTFLSLASTLNFDYLPALLEGEIDRASVDRQEAYRLLRDNAVASFLRSRGYRYVHLQSTWGGTGSNAYADDFLPCGGGFFRDEYLLAIAEISWLRVLGSTASIDLANCHLKNLETLKGLPQTQGPKFVLAHFVPPHHPYLFGRNGDVLRRANLSNQFEFQKRLWEDRRAYADQLAFMNDSIGSVVDRLIAESGRTPIIVLLSDHGPNIRRGLSADQHYGIRLATLSAVLVPGAPPGLVPQDLSNVNLFRLVFNEAFGAGMPLLPNRHFVSSFSQPFDFHEVRSDGTRLEPGSDAADNM